MLGAKDVEIALLNDRIVALEAALKNVAARPPQPGEQRDDQPA